MSGSTVTTICVVLDASDDDFTAYRGGTVFVAPALEQRARELLPNVPVIHRAVHPAFPVAPRDD